jgi:hypothetical protein
MPADLQAQFAEMQEVMGEVEYTDITDPWLYSPR